jgi:deoxyadenosine/deoxycytidine kinase
VRYRYVAVEGPIGVGKTTLATALAAHWQARLVLEQPAANPYLERYYLAMAAMDGRASWRDNPVALQTQLCFLFQRTEQLAALGQPGMFESGVVSDFMFAKDAIFATLTLGDDDLALYRQVHQRLAERAVEPDLVIWLHAAPDTLLERVHRRARGMERPISADYLEALSAAYQRHFASHPGMPVLAVDTEGFHPADGGPNFQRLLDRIERFQGPFELLDPPGAPGDLHDTSVTAM